MPCVWKRTERGHTVPQKTLLVQSRQPNVSFRGVHGIRGTTVIEVTFTRGAGIMISLHFSQLVARTIGWRRGVSPRCGRAHHLHRRASLRGLLISLATICDLLPPARNGAMLEERRMERVFPTDQAPKDALQPAAPVIAGHHVCEGALPAGYTFCRVAREPGGVPTTVIMSSLEGSHHDRTDRDTRRIPSRHDPR
jgi:hypothetical protein